MSKILCIYHGNCPLHGIDPDRTRDERRDA